MPRAIPNMRPVNPSPPWKGVRGRISGRSSGRDASGRASGDICTKTTYHVGDTTGGGADEQHFEARRKRFSVREERPRGTNDKQHRGCQSGGKRKARYPKIRHDIGEQWNASGRNETREGSGSIAGSLAQGGAIIMFRSLGRDVAGRHRYSVRKEAREAENQNGLVRERGADDPCNDCEGRNDPVVSAIDQFR